MTRLALRILPLVLLAAACAEQPTQSVEAPGDRGEATLGTIATDSTTTPARPCPSECSGG